jgi:hypothetical protein
MFRLVPARAGKLVVAEQVAYIRRRIGEELIDVRVIREEADQTRELPNITHIDLSANPYDKVIHTGRPREGVLLGYYDDGFVEFNNVLEDAIDTTLSPDDSDEFLRDLHRELSRGA